MEATPVLTQQRVVEFEERILELDRDQEHCASKFRATASTSTVVFESYEARRWAYELCVSKGELED